GYLQNGAEALLRSLRLDRRSGQRNTTRRDLTLGFMEASGIKQLRQHSGGIEEDDHGCTPCDVQPVIGRLGGKFTVGPIPRAAHSALPTCPHPHYVARCRTPAHALPAGWR